MSQAMTDAAGAALDAVCGIVPMFHAMGWGVPFTASMPAVSKSCLIGLWIGKAHPADDRRGGDYLCGIRPFGKE